MPKRKIVITESGIEIHGFDDVEFKNENITGTCRDVARFATAWGISRLAEDLEKDLIGDWENQRSGIV